MRSDRPHAAAYQATALVMEMTNLFELLVQNLNCLMLLFNMFLIRCLLLFNHVPVLAFFLLA